MAGLQVFIKRNKVTLFESKCNNWIYAAQNRKEVRIFYWFRSQSQQNHTKFLLTYVIRWGFFSVKKLTFEWPDNHANHFEETKIKLAEFLKKTLWNPNIETKVKGDTSRHCLGAVLEQFYHDGWITFAFTFRFVNSVKTRHSIKTLALLGVVLNVETFKDYLYDQKYTTITNHSALLSTMK